MTTTPQEKALIEAALAWDKSPSHINVTALIDATESYRATLTPPRECRPPDGAKDGDLFWLTNPTEKIVGEWVHNGWRLPGTQITALEAGEDGWTVHGPCIFPGTGGEATRDALCLFLKSHGYDYATIPMLSALIQAALTHFRAPKLKISDEELAEIGRKFKVSGGLRFSDFDERLKQAARAVIAKASEGES